MAIVHLILSLMLFAVAVLMPVCALGLAVNYFLSIPMRRQERARLFLDLLETALKRGASPERTLVEMAATRDAAPGVRFHLLSAYLEEGLRLDEALEKVPRLVPPSVSAILKAGIRLGNLPRVLPACRQVLQDSHSSVRSATSYAVVLLLSCSPMMVLVVSMLYVFVLPKFNEIFDGMEIESSPWLQLITQHPRWVVGPPLVAFAALLVAAFFYIGGPRVAGWLQLGIFPVSDCVAWRLPWKRHRLQRTFSVMLATLLDGGMPEAEAVRLAADCTANEIVRRRADNAVAALARGEKLAGAITAVDPHGEFRWRLKNAAHGGAGSFLRALNGWHASLDARAFREEQTAAHLTTSGLVVLNGVLVAIIALGTFGSIISLIEAGLLW